MSAEQIVEQSYPVGEQALKVAIFLLNVLVIFLWFDQWHVFEAFKAGTYFGRQRIEIPGVSVLFLYLTSFGTPATQYVRPLFLVSPFSSIIAGVSSQFSTSRLLNIIVWAAR